MATKGEDLNQGPRNQTRSKVLEEKEDSGGMKKWQSPGVKYWLCDGSWKRKASLGVALGGHEEAFHALQRAAHSVDLQRSPGPRPHGVCLVECADGVWIDSWGFLHTYARSCPVWGAVGAWIKRSSLVSCY